MPRKKIQTQLVDELTALITTTVSETNGITLDDTLDLMLSSTTRISTKAKKSVKDFRNLLSAFQINQADIHELLKHPFSDAFFRFFHHFPLPYKEEHTHLTGSLSAEFIYPRLKKLLDGPTGDAIREKIDAVYGKGASNIRSVEDVDKLVRLKDHERFDRYLQVLMLTKLVLASRTAHEEAAYHMAKEMYEQYNVGSIRLKFTMSRSNSTNDESEMIPGFDKLTSEDVVLGLYDGFAKFKAEFPEFQFTLSPLFRKEVDYYDAKHYLSKKEDVEAQIDEILGMLEKHPQLVPHMTDIDTVGNERAFFRKQHFLDMKRSFRKLQYSGFAIRSHHGETWKTLRYGIQAVDNAMNIWHIDTLEHGLALGVNPNFYFHSLFLRILADNAKGDGFEEGSIEYNELMDMEWNDQERVRDKLISGKTVSEEEKTIFTKVKFHTATEIEHYQHDVLNRMINKKVSLVALPSSNFRLTHFVADYKDHPFSWWEKKGVRLGVGTDNYVTLNTNYIQEMLILLYTDAQHLKITKLLMVTTGETRRPYLSSLLWQMHKEVTD